MKRFTLLVTVLGMMVLLTGCPDRHRYDKAWFPGKPANFWDVNSVFDDYNSALPELHFGKKLIFSSNRRSQGDNFDIFDGNFHAIWDMETGGLQVIDMYTGPEEVRFHSEKILKAIDNAGDQFAPYAIGFDTLINDTVNRIDFLAYSTSGGSYSFRSEFVYYIKPYNENAFEVKGPFTIRFLGDSKRQQYISFYGPDVMFIDDWELNPDRFTEIYFDQTSENGKSDIYKIDIPDSLTFLAFLQSADSNLIKEKVSALNSSENDRAPFVNGQFMVFASDRPGGFGGYDLYYSKFENGAWSDPVNFGDRINTEYDEFRPVAVHVFGFQNDLMIFSSNRPGGMGGYDLYYVGIEKIFSHPLLE